MFKKINKDCKRKEIMEKEFVPYQLSFDMKKLGFDEPCFYQYVRDFDNDGELIPITSETNYPILRNNTEVSNYSGGDCFAAPTFSQTFRWFREKYNLYHSIGLDNSLENDVNCDYQIINHSQSISELETNFKSYEEAELECLIKLIKIVKEKE